MKTAIILALGVVAACGPAKRNGNGDDGSGGSGGADAPDGQCVPSSAGEGAPGTCNDGIDNDCDGIVDCGDVDCSGVDGCAVCGAVDDPSATPIYLPDGISSGASCTDDAGCLASSPSTPNCIVFQDSGTTTKECHASYDSALNFIGFPNGATLTDPTKLINVCVNIEHSYLHDLQMELLSPPDAGGVRRKIVLNAFVGRVGPKIFLGEPIDDDTSAAGTGYKYCWTQAATSDMDSVGGSTSNMWGGYKQLLAGDYKPSAPFAGLTGAPLNGMWQMRVTDLYSIDNGHLFGWSIKFDASLVADCSGPIIN